MNKTPGCKQGVHTPSHRGLHKSVINIYKPPGLTPLQLISKLKEKYPKYRNRKISYAGRLDPLAHGVMVLLVEPETKNKDHYQNLDKEYEFEVLFGTETDSYDLLGKLSRPKLELKEETKTKHRVNVLEAEFDEWLRKELKDLIGKRTQTYPAFSSKTIKGKPLFWWARVGKLDEIKIPTREIEIYSAKLIKTHTLTGGELQEKVVKRIGLVKGNFRQKEILKLWLNLLRRNPKEKYQVAKIRIHCSTGTYVRSLAHLLGQNLGTGAIALEILRTKVGEYSLTDSTKLSFSHANL